jgi:hypothetical protein
MRGILALVANVDDCGPKVERGEASWGEWCGTRGCEGAKVFYLLAVVLRWRSRGWSCQTMIEVIGLQWDDHDEHWHVTGATWLFNVVPSVPTPTHTL